MEGRFSVFPHENFVDLFIVQFGWEQCESLYSYGPHVRNNYLFHYSISGRGRLEVRQRDGTLKTYPLISESAKQAGVKRLLIVGGAGTLFYAPGKMVMDADDVPAQLLPGIKSLGEFYLNTLRKEKDIDWIFLSPAANMTPGKRTAKFRIGKDDLVVDANGDSNISVEDFAVAMVDELEQEKHHKERFTIGY